MSFPRVMEPEWLDELPGDDPRAVRSRRDLKLVNRLMFQARITAGLLRGCGWPSPRHLIELGGGDGSFMLGAARRLKRRWPGVHVTLVDQQNIASETTRAGFRAIGWEIETVQADVFDFLEKAGSDSANIVTANLFLHHFADDALERLFAEIARVAPRFVAAEPERSRFALLGAKLLFALGCNDVTRHDAVASVRAGFRAGELSTAWPDAPNWEIIEKPVFPFTHVFAARRR